MFFRFNLWIMVGSGQFDRIRPKGSDPAPSPQHCWLANVNKSKMGEITDERNRDCSCLLPRGYRNNS